MYYADQTGHCYGAKGPGHLDILAFRSLSILGNMRRPDVETVKERTPASLKLELAVFGAGVSNIEGLEWGMQGESSFHTSLPVCVLGIPVYLLHYSYCLPLALQK